MVIAMLLCTAALAAELPWWGEPTATRLVATRPRYGLRLRVLAAASSAFPGGSPAFRQPWSEMDAYWAMLASQESAFPVDPRSAERNRDLAFAAMALGLGRLADETVERAGAFRVVYRAGLTVVSPSVDLRSGPSGMELHANDSTVLSPPRLARARLDEPRQGRVGTPRRAEIRAGLAPYAAQVPETPGSGRTELRVAAFVDARRVLLDGFRASIDLWRAELPLAGRAFELRPAWDLVLREAVHPRWTLVAGGRGDPGDWGAGTVREAVDWRLLRARPWWNLRLLHSVSMRFDDGTLRERRVELAIEWLGPWRAPIDPRRPAPGGRYGRPDPWWAARAGRSVSPLRVPVGAPGKAPGAAARRFPASAPVPPPGW